MRFEEKPANFPASMRVKSLRSLMSLAAAALLVSNPSPAQKVEVDISACPLMFNVLKAMKDGLPRDKISGILDSVLAAVPYQIMFKHYNRSWRPNHLPKDVFKRMILSLRFEGEYSPGENERADKMLEKWREFYGNLPLFEKNLRQLEKADLMGLINDGLRYAQSWLPPDWKIPDFRVFVHPNGGSTAFSIDGTQGYDFYQLPRDASSDIDWDQLIGTISHESHHSGMKGSTSSSMTPSDSLALRFLSFFVGEGTATKFISNAPGGCVPAVPGGRFHAFKGELTVAWNNYTSEETEIFRRMIATFEKAYSGGMTAEDLDTEMRDYWFSGFLGRAYFVGAELFGAIFHAFGKTGVFAAMEDPRKIFELYNRSIEKKPELLGGCFRIPKPAVRQALAIGEIQK